MEQKERSSETPSKENEFPIKLKKYSWEQTNGSKTKTVKFAVPVMRFPHPNPAEKGKTLYLPLLSSMVREKTPDSLTPLQTDKSSASSQLRQKQDPLLPAAHSSPTSPQAKKVDLVLSPSSTATFVTAMQKDKLPIRIYKLLHEHFQQLEDTTLKEVHSKIISKYLQKRKKAIYNEIISLTGDKGKYEQQKQEGVTTDGTAGLLRLKSLEQDETSRIKKKITDCEKELVETLLLKDKLLSQYRQELILYAESFSPIQKLSDAIYRMDETLSTIENWKLILLDKENSEREGLLDFEALDDKKIERKITSYKSEDVLSGAVDEDDMPSGTAKESLVSVSDVSPLLDDKLKDGVVKVALSTDTEDYLPDMNPKEFSGCDVIEDFFPDKSEESDEEDEQEDGDALIPYEFSTKDEILFLQTSLESLPKEEFDEEDEQEVPPEFSAKDEILLLQTLSRSLPESEHGLIKQRIERLNQVIISEREPSNGKLLEKKASKEFPMELPKQKDLMKETEIDQEKILQNQKIQLEEQIKFLKLLSIRRQITKLDKEILDPKKKLSAELQVSLGKRNNLVRKLEILASLPRVTDDKVMNPIKDKLKDSKSLIVSRLEEIDKTEISLRNKLAGYEKELSRFADEFRKPDSWLEKRRQKIDNQIKEFQGQEELCEKMLEWIKNRKAEQEKSREKCKEPDEKRKISQKSSSSSSPALLAGFFYSVESAPPVMRKSQTGLFDKGVTRKNKGHTTPKSLFEDPPTGQSKLISSSAGGIQAGASRLFDGGPIKRKDKASSTIRKTLFDDVAATEQPTSVPIADLTSSPNADRRG